MHEWEALQRPVEHPAGAWYRQRVYRRKDSFYTRAKATGYRSRAAFKLQELADRYTLFHPGDHVIDLGAWPGGWLQVSARLVGPAGRVVGVDLQPIAALGLSNVRTLVGDITDPATEDRLADACEAADVVLSDLAPKLSGIRARDAAGAQTLFEHVVSVCRRLLRRNGTLLLKVLMDADTPERITRLRSLFRDVCSTRPQATRKGSAELYVIARGFRGAPAKPESVG